MDEVNSKLVDPKNTAVLVIDMQNAYCSPSGSMAKLEYDVSPITEIIPDINIFLKLARRAGLPIVFTRMIEDEKYMAENAGIKMRAKDFSAISSPDTSNMDYFGVKPEVGDLEITKSSYDAFTNKDLEAFLVGKQIKNLIIIGVNSDVCVDTTLRSAYSKGYNVVVPKELVATTRQNVDHQKSALEVWDKFFAHIYNFKKIIEYWEKNEK